MMKFIAMLSGALAALSPDISEQEFGSAAQSTAGATSWVGDINAQPSEMYISQTIVQWKFAK